VCLVAAAPGAGVPLEGILPRGATPRQLQHVPRRLDVQLHQHKYILEKESDKKLTNSDLRDNPNLRLPVS
jgi:hypothetical protein